MERIDPYTPLISGIGQNIWIHFPNGLLLNRQCFYSHQQHQGRSSGINNRTMKHNFGLWRWWGGVSNLEVRTHGEHIESWWTGRVGTRSPQCSLRCSKSTLSCTAVWKVCACRVFLERGVVHCSMRQLPDPACHSADGVNTVCHPVQSCVCVFVLLSLCRWSAAQLNAVYSSAQCKSVVDCCTSEKYIPIQRSAQ